MLQEAIEAARTVAARYQQSHLFRFWEELSQDQRELLASQILALDFDQLDRLFAGVEKSVDWNELAGRAKPPAAIRLHSADNEYSIAQAIERGEDALRQGKIAMILVAGGQGTRLGFDLPKGMFRIGPVSNRTLFEMHVDSLRAAMKRYGVSIPLFVMTSPATDTATREYFEKHQRCGLRSDELTIFCQGTMPAIDAQSGKVLMEEKGVIALSPDGHGGIVAALKSQGVFEVVADRGIEHFFYAQVDNPMVRACDPTLIGYHLLARSEMTTQVVSKRAADEKVGNVVSIEGRTHIIEYSDLPADIARQCNADGSLKLWAGNIAVHVLDVKFLESVTQKGHELPFHRASKSVPFLNDEGQLVKPSRPNAIKFERFVFDLLPLAARSIVVEGDAKEVFAPVKNADGSATDTPTSTRDAMIAQHRRWLEEAGITVSDNAKVEINPNWALDAAEVQKKIQKPTNLSVDLSVDTYFA